MTTSIVTTSEEHPYPFGSLNPRYGIPQHLRNEFDVRDEDDTFSEPRYWVQPHWRGQYDVVEEEYTSPADIRKTLSAALTERLELWAIDVEARSQLRYDRPQRESWAATGIDVRLPTGGTQAFTGVSLYSAFHEIAHFLLEAHEITEETVRAVEETGIMHASSLPESLREKQREAILAAKKYRDEQGNPVDQMEAILAAVVYDPEVWQEIIDEPYG